MHTYKNYRNNVMLSIDNCLHREAEEGGAIKSSISNSRSVSYLMVVAIKARKRQHGIASHCILYPYYTLLSAHRRPHLVHSKCNSRRLCVTNLPLGCRVYILLTKSKSWRLVIRSPVSRFRIFPTNPFLLASSHSWYRVMSLVGYFGSRRS